MWVVKGSMAINLDHVQKIQLVADEGKGRIEFVQRVGMPDVANVFEFDSFSDAESFYEEVIGMSGGHIVCSEAPKFQDIRESPQIRNNEEMIEQWKTRREQVEEKLKEDTPPPQVSNEEPSYNND